MKTQIQHCSQKQETKRENCYESNCRRFANGTVNIEGAFLGDKLTSEQ